LEDPARPAGASDLGRLIARAKADDRDAFAEIYRLTVTPVYRYLAARLSSVEEAEELTQEVFLAALTGIEGLRARDETGLLAWLFQIARFKLADLLRRRYRRPTAPIEAADRVEATEGRPEEVADRLGDRAAIQAALDRLTPDQREVIVCKYVLGYDNQRTAAITGKNPNAVNQIHHRAIGALHRLIGRSEDRG
jgi:RNA polymerase sigma-70 factor (ECF subfamily)